MSEIYTVTAKSVDEAMELASKLYGGSNKEISYDIVSLPKKGFLGLGSKDAVIRVTVSEDEDAGLSSIVNEIKSYKAKTAPETGYYTSEAGKEVKQEKKEAKKKPTIKHNNNNKKTSKQNQQEKKKMKETIKQPKPAKK